jgi:hypothetical protein
LKGGNPSLTINAVFTWDKGLRIEIYIDGSLAKQAFSLLSEHKDEIEKTLGNQLIWDELPDARASRLLFYMPGQERPDNRGRWKEQRNWLLTWAPKLAESLRPFLSYLEFPTVETPEIG